MKIIHENSRLQAAILQAEHGHRVHPCHYITEDGGCSCGKCDPSQHGKHPALTGWQKAASTTETTLRQWWTDQPECNIGIATGPGSDLLIVDIDTRGKNGFKDLQELDPAGLGFDGIKTPKARTGSGGGQLYFAWPTGCKLTTGAGIAGKAIDFRGIGGNAIAPGSANNLGQYKWIVSLTDCGKAECPEWLLNFLSEGKASSSQQERPPAKAPAKVENSSSSLILRVAEETGLAAHPGTGEGERNALLCKLVGGALASGIDPDEVMQQALAWNQRCTPPKGAAGIRKSVKAIIDRDRGGGTGSSTAAQPTLKEMPPASPPVQPAAAATAKQILITRRASDIKPQVVKWLWPNHIQSGAVNLIAGPEGRGKSLVSVDIAARTSTGAAWPDGSPCERGRVLYCSAEENIEAVVVPRLMAAGADLTRIEIVDGLGSSSDEKKVIGDIDLKKCLPAVYNKLKDIGDGEPFRLCIWDTFQSVCLTADHKSNTEQKAIVQPLQAIADELGVAMICIEHHNRGGLGRGNPDAAILGGGLTRTARVIWHVVEDPESPELMRLFIPGKMNNCSKAEDLGWRFTFEDSEHCIAGQQVTLPRVEWIEPAGVTIHEVQSKVNGEAGSGDSEKGQFAAAVEWLREHLTEPTSAAVMEQGFKSDGFTKSTMQRAKDHLCIKSKRTPEGWLWMPSPQVSIGGEVIADPMAK
jgi:hypothetical protein